MICGVSVLQQRLQHMAKVFGVAVKRGAHKLQRDGFRKLGHSLVPFARQGDLNQIRNRL